MPTFTAEELKIRLDKFLASQLPEFSRGRIQKCIAEGLTEVNGKVAGESKFAVRRGDVIKFTPPKTKNALKPVNVPLKILYNNHGLLILDKPPGLCVHSGAGVKGDSLAQGLLYHFKAIKGVGESQRPGIVHRLDKDTSGVMLAALTPQMYEHLKDAFAKRKVQKEYLALLAGRLEPFRGFINTPIGKSRTDFRRYAAKNMLLAKPALTEYQALEYLSPPPPASSADKRRTSSPGGVDNWTLVRVKLHTGRTHQIRVHFLSLGHPLAGDLLYGGKLTKLPGLSRQFLHASKIAVRLPGGEWVEAQSLLPDDLREVLAALGSKKVKEL